MVTVFTVGLVRRDVRMEHFLGNRATRRVQVGSATIPARSVAVLVAALALAACGGEGGNGGDAGPGASVTEAATTEPTTTQRETRLPGGQLVRCESPAGFVIGRPESWQTNSGEVVPGCSQLHPEPFEVPEGTDERVAAITAYIDPVPFPQIAAPDDARDADRANTAIDGLQAVRLDYETDGGALWPEGTPITLYAVDVGEDSDGEPRTLFIDTVGLETFDYERNQVVLDRVARSVEVTLDDVETDLSVVARYGGAGGFAVEAEAARGEGCLRIPPDGEPACTELPPADQAHTIHLTDLEPVLAGLTGSDVFRVRAELRDGRLSTFLPAPVPGTDAGAFAFTFDLDAVERLTLYDVTGEELRVIEPGG